MLKVEKRNIKSVLFSILTCVGAGGRGGRITPWCLKTCVSAKNRRDKVRGTERNKMALDSNISDCSGFFCLEQYPTTPGSFQ